MFLLPCLRLQHVHCWETCEAFPLSAHDAQMSPEPIQDTWTQVSVKFWINAFKYSEDARMHKPVYEAVPHKMLNICSVHTIADKSLNKASKASKNKTDE